jgi:hypothetical protein
LALCGRRHRSLLPPCGWLVDERSDDGPARHRRPGDGDLATGQVAADGATWLDRRLVVREGAELSMSGPSREVWEHSIPAVEAQRYSITFRTMAAKS